MRAALEAYLAGGGRLMYLGGNGFYWVTDVAPGRPHLMEVRRGHAGTRAGDSAPGEGVHSTTGRRGGLWRHRGKPPQSLAGVGFTAQGWADGAAYTRAPELPEPLASKLFAGISQPDEIGAFGPLGGAAADEIDRADATLGTDARAVIVATSRGRHSDAYQLTIEELNITLPTKGGTLCADVRSDVVYTELPGGGAYFSVGSIGWSLCLPHDDGDNDIARLTTNALEHLLSVGDS
jgi:N,N-dimethylformamidase